MDLKFIDAKQAESNDEERTIVGWASKPVVDRDKELILSDAWKLDNFQKNPVLLLAHKHDQMPVGKILWIKADNSGLKFKAKFAKTERGQEVYELYKEGMLNMFSVGFSTNKSIDNPTDPKYKGVKRLFTDVELLEISCVPIGANQGALAEYVKAGKVHTKGLKDELDLILKELNIEEKIEVTDNYVHVPVKAEEEKHADCKIRTIDISKKDGIKGVYCVDDKVVTSYMFDKEKFTKDQAVKWVDDHTKSFEIVIGENESIEYKALDTTVYFDEENDLVIGTKAICDDINIEEEIVTKAAIVPDAEEDEATFMERCQLDETMTTDFPDDGERKIACQAKWDDVNKAKKDIETKAKMAPEDGETVDVFMERCMAEDGMDKDSCQVLWDENNKTIDNVETKELKDLLGAFDLLKKEFADMKEKYSTMPQMEPAVVGISNTKTADAQGNPSLYDITSAINLGLNNIQNSIQLGNEPGCYRYVVDIYPTEFPSGHVVYSENCSNEPCEYQQIDYAYDLKERTVTFSGDPVEVLQSWVTDRYGDIETAEMAVREISTKQIETLENEIVELKAGRVISDSNMQILNDCLAKMQAAMAAMQNLMTNASPKEPPAFEEVKIEEIIEIKDAEPEHIDIEAMASDEVTFTPDEIKGAIEEALKSMPQFDTKEIVEETFSRMKGKVIR